MCGFVDFKAFVESLLLVGALYTEAASSLGRQVVEQYGKLIRKASSAYQMVFDLQCCSFELTHEIS